jgi:alpha,alpha-trehalase
MSAWLSSRSDVLGACIALFMAACGHAADAPRQTSTRSTTEAASLTPDELYGELFSAVQLGHVFADQKAFADAVPNKSPAEIMHDYAEVKHDPKLDLKAFVLERFALTAAKETAPPRGLALTQHIEWLWPRLTREAKRVPEGSSLLALPKPYVVPGGRYQELYYWDSYFTMLGLAKSGQRALVLSMLDDFAYEIDRYGHIPNGSRSYQLSRSQPPFFACMVELAAGLEGESVYTRYLPQLRREHAFWMDGASELAVGSAQRRVVRLADGTLLNRYWDDRDTPRPEAYANDVATAAADKSRPPTVVYRELRAAAESGWDFSSRWLADGATLSTIQTTSYLPIDLNSLLYRLEQVIAHACEIAHDRACVESFAELAKKRSAAIDRYLWNDAGYFYTDFNWTRAEAVDAVTAAVAFALFSGVATPERAQQTAKALERLLAPGGLVTTSRKTDEQWDSPNGWAPLVWIAVSGLRRYEQHDLAREIGTRFLSRIEALFATEAKLVEKYDVQSAAVRGGGGGEYPLQDGFGWTNGVTLELLELYGRQQP